ncbi:RHS repeat domain-containing protein [Mucilaginibacter sp. RCC_168]|uniref:RHS repeat domain-containing protein n=1 Tax=Mucilaginibacter sp. RCC_168 TaxID=3239221 RepID=UPI003525557D
MTKRLILTTLLILLAVSGSYAQDIISSAPIVLPVSPQTSYSVASGNTVNIISKQSVTLGPGTTLASGSVVRISVNATLVVPPPSNPSNDFDKNWVNVISYDENGKEIGASKKFFDNNGKLIQTQIKNETTTQVLASQPLYDLQGRAVGNTLSAPINNAAFAYKNGFVTNGGNNYSYLNFDGDPSNAGNPYAKLNAPDAVDNSQQGTLGWYYSNNNTQEPMVGATGFPYSRTDFYHDGTGAVKRYSGIGEQLKMGTGHEATSNSFPVQHELDNYLAIRNQFFPSATAGMGPATLAGQALQSVATDQNGTTVLSVTDLSGKQNLMTGRADVNGYLPINNTITAVNQQPLYSFTAANPNGSTINSLTVSSPNVVTVTSLYDHNDASCGCVSPDYTGIGNNYVYSGTDQNSYKVTSNYPFWVSENLFIGALPNPIVPLYDQAEAQSVEPSGTSVQYFRLNATTPVTIAGNYYSLYNMTTEADITSSFTSGSSLPAGYYKLTANPAPTSGANPAGTSTITVTYANKYADLTYNYYNQLGQLIGSIAPNGVNALLQNGYGGYTSASQLPFITLYQYDLKGRMIAAATPDGGTSQFVYRLDGKIRFSQNAYQKVAANAGAGNVEKFSYTNYDTFGRPIESGEYAVTTATFAGLTANTTLLEATGAAANIAGTTKLSPINTYYDIPATNLALAGYTQDAGFLKGSVSFTSNANNTTWYNYDDHGRVTWMVKQLAGLTGYKTVNYTYNDQGNVSVVEYQRGTPAERFLHYYTYDADSRLINVQTSTDGTNMAQQAHYYYYLHGPLKRTELGDQLQGIDYTYTSQGWLKAINTPTGDATKDPQQDGASNNFAKDAFGMQLEYFNGDYSRTGSNITNIPTGTVNYYNGNVTGMSWQSNKPASVVSADPTIQNPTMYSYAYDPKYQYTKSAWGTPNYSNGSFAPATKFAENSINYDANGNMLGLQRTNSSGTLSDNFSQYTYQAGTNKLNTVGNSAAPAAYASFTYDEIGRLKSENKAGSAFAYYLKYDVTGKITGIYADAALSQLKIGYAYDENGNRISRTDNTGPSPAATYYVYGPSGNVLGIYTGTTLSEIPVYGNDRLGTYFTSGTRYVYEIRDNVGSVRVAINRSKVNGQADIVQYNDYYPYGSIARSGGSGYRYDYQGAYAEKDPVTGFSNFDLRMYDSRIGRWLSTDPKNIGFTPYNGMGNNPVSSFDKDGGNPEEKPDGTPLYDPGDWHVSDRINNTDAWRKANLYNLQNGNFDQYQTITQRTDFYGWFQGVTQSRGFETLWPGAAYIVARQMSKLDNSIIAWWVGDDVVKFGNAGNTAIFNDVFANLGKLYNGPVLKGSAAADWDRRALHHEQFDVVQPIYLIQSAETIKILTNMATGSYLYGLGVTGPLRFEGNLMNPQDRYDHGATKVTNFYKLQQIYNKAGW